MSCGAVLAHLAGADALFERDEFEFQTWAVTQLDAEPNEKRSRDKGVDGVASFYIDRMTTGRVTVSVKGGRNVIPRDVRDLVGTVATQNAQMGVLVMRVRTVTWRTRCGKPCWHVHLATERSSLSQDSDYYH